jgi:hypothetical protein
MSQVLHSSFKNAEDRLRKTHAAAKIVNCGAGLYLAKSLGTLLFGQFRLFYRFHF